MQGTAWQDMREDMKLVIVIIWKKQFTRHAMRQT